MDAFLNNENLPTVITAVAWPVAAVIIVLILRPALIKLLPGTRKVKFKELEVDFGQALSKAEKEAEKAQQQKHSPSAKNTTEVDLYELAAVSPTAAVISAWHRVDNSAKQLLIRRGVALENNSETPYKQVQSALMCGDVVEERWCKVFDELRQLRNKVAHAPGFVLKPDAAKHYVDLALQLTGYLDNLQAGQ